MPAVFRKVFLLFTLLIGLLVSVFLATSVTINRQTRAESVSIFFTPETLNLPPDTTIKLMVDPNGQGISFVKTSIRFDPEVLQLTGAPVIANSGLNIHGQVTSVSEANSTGIINITLVAKPQGAAPNETFEIFSLPITFLESAPPTNTQISIVDEETQIVDTEANSLPFSITLTQISVKNAEERANAAGMAVTPNKQQGRCGSDEYIDTAIGCIPVNDSQLLAEFFLKWGLGIGGGIALLLIGYSSYMIMTSSGDPKKIQGGKELLVAAVSGLVLLVFGAFILRFFGVDVLGIF